MRIGIVSVAALGLALAACGSNTEQRAASGGLTGAGVGALVGGPVGAVAGAAIGAGGGAVLDEGVEKKAERAVDNVTNDDRSMSGATSRDRRMGSGGDRASRDEVRRAQEALRAQGLYNDRVDGIMGPKTKAALREFQQREGLQQTATLDRATMQRLGAGNRTGATGTDMRSSTGGMPSSAGSGAGASSMPAQPRSGSGDATGGASGGSSSGSGASSGTR